MGFPEAIRALDKHYILSASLIAFAGVEGGSL